MRVLPAVRRSSSVTRSSWCRSIGSVAKELRAEGAGKPSAGTAQSTRLAMASMAYP
jgi:hypothetical protein